MTETSPQPDIGREFDSPFDADVQDPDVDEIDLGDAPEASHAVSASSPFSVATPSSGAFEGMDQESLESLILRVMRQDELALGALYDRLGGAVYSLAIQITRNIGTAEEVLQDVFWQVWRQAPRFDSARGSVPAWVLTITRSRALDAARSAKRTPETHVDASDEMEHALPSHDAGPQDLLFAAQQGSRLKAALEGLDPLRRQLMSLSFYKGLTQQEISEQTGLPLGTVKTHLRRALITLREALGVDVAPAQS